MAEDQAGLRKDYVKELAPWSRLFSAFKIALDPKKLLLAAAGILTMALGWYVLAVIFFALDSTPPKWGKDYEGFSDKDKKHVAWQRFKSAGQCVRRSSLVTWRRARRRSTAPFPTSVTAARMSSGTAMNRPYHPGVGSSPPGCRTRDERQTAAMPMYTAPVVHQSR